MLGKFFNARGEIAMNKIAIYISCGILVLGGAFYTMYGCAALEIQILKAVGMLDTPLASVRDGMIATIVGVLLMVSGIKYLIR